MINELRFTFKFMIQGGRFVDIDELKRIHSKLLSFGDWLEKKNVAVN